MASPSLESVVSEVLAGAAVLVDDSCVKTKFPSADEGSDSGDKEEEGAPRDGSTMAGEESVDTSSVLLSEEGGTGVIAVAGMGVIVVAGTGVITLAGKGGIVGSVEEVIGASPEGGGEVIGEDFSSSFGCLLSTSFFSDDLLELSICFLVSSDGFFYSGDSIERGEKI